MWSAFSMICCKISSLVCDFAARPCLSYASTCSSLAVRDLVTLQARCMSQKEYEVLGDSIGWRLRKHEGGL